MHFWIDRQLRVLLCVLRAGLATFSQTLKVSKRVLNVVALVSGAKASAFFPMRTIGVGFVLEARNRRQLAPRGLVGRGEFEPSLGG